MMRISGMIMKQLWDMLKAGQKQLILLGVLCLMGSLVVQWGELSAGTRVAYLVLGLTGLIVYLLETGLIRHFIGGSSLRRMDLEHRLEIDASPRVIWDEIYPRPRTDPYQMGYTRITAVEGHPDQFDLFVDSRYADPKGAKEIQIRIQTEQVQPERYYFISYPLGFPKTSGFTSEGAEYEIVPLETGGCEVRYKEIAEMDQWWLALAMRFVNPAKDTLESLKAQIEGTEDMSLAGQIAAHMQAGGTDPAAAPVLRQVGRRGTGGLAAVAVGLTLFLPIFMWAILTVVGA